MRERGISADEEVHATWRMERGAKTRARDTARARVIVPRVVLEVVVVLGEHGGDRPRDKGVDREPAVPEVRLDKRCDLELLSNSLALSISIPDFFLSGITARQQSSRKVLVYSRLDETRERDRQCFLVFESGNELKSLCGQWCCTHLMG